LGASASEREQLGVAPSEQAQPAPLIAVAVNLAGSKSVTVTVPELAMVPTLLTVIV
jgi:hypothetical protein